MAKRTGPDRVAAIHAKRPPDVALAGGADPIPRRLVALVLALVARGREKIRA